MDLIEFIEYLDEVIDYEKIHNEYDLTYSEIAEHIQLLKDKASKQDVEADAKIKDAIMQIYEGNEVKGLDILCLLVGWIPNGKASQPDNSAVTCEFHEYFRNCDTHMKYCPECGRLFC